MPSGDALSGMGIATFGEAGPSHSVAVNPLATTPELGTEAIAGSAKEKEVPPQPFILGEGLPAIPAKLANKIQRGEFVDMAELLKDNIEAERRRVAHGQEGSSSSHTPSRTSRKEVPDLLSWLQCFGKYACVFSEKFPEKNRELWAYMIFLIRESQRCNGEGWRDYDSMFRQQAASAVDLEWSKVNNSLFSVTFLAQGSGRGKACKFCQETDHGPDVCALAPRKTSLGETASGEKKPASRDGWSWRPKAERVCYSWNEGRCVYHPYCRFQHVCANPGCQGDHRAVECRHQGRFRQGESRKEAQPDKNR